MVAFDLIAQKFGVNAVFFGQVLGFAGGGDSAGVDDDNTVDILDGRETVGDDDN